MTITLSIRDLTITPTTRERAESQSLGFSRYFANVQSVEWDFSRDAGQVFVRCRVHSRSGFYRASARGDSARKALDLAIEKLLKQRRRKKIVRQRRRRVAD